jgi:diguanylate cyclase (GGDEF)-like protein
VRAPRYLLAVRTGAESRLHVHHRGYRDDEASAAAHALLERTGEGHDESRLVPEVESASRHYGRLMAVSPGVSFFPHERDLLDVYARYAAAVLDTATALDDARRHDQAWALLELAQNVAVAGTREEVAQRLVDAVPVVVDCDRVAVFLWNETDDALTCHAVTEFTGDRDDVVRDLTRLLGHRAFQEALDERLRVDGPDPTFTLATIDIDDFKLVNDAHGHPAGDEALCHVADALRRSVRDQDTVFRVGGEEFAVLLPGLVARDALPVAERLRAAVAGAPFSPALRVSIGLASWPQDAPDRDALLRRADAALYAAKRAGKDQTALAA